MDGGLSVKIAGVERVADVHGLEWESTNLGDGEAHFWMEVADPFDPQATYAELLHGATVVAEHTKHDAGVNAPLTTIWEDVSGNDNDGILTNFAGESPWAGTGMAADPDRVVFDGTNDYVALPDLGVAEDKICTYEAWIAGGAQVDTMPGIVEEYGGGNVALYIDHTTGYPYAYMYDDSADSVDIAKEVNVLDDEIHHIVAVFDGTNAVVYVDKFPGSTAALPADTVTLTHTRIGAGSVHFFTDSILAARMYKGIAFTSAQVAQNNAAGPQASSAIYGSGVVPGATVELVAHDAVATTTKLYNGYVLSDPRAGYAGEQAIVQVECGGVLEVAKSRGDVGFIFTDNDESQWFANKRNPKCYSVDASDRVDIRVADNAKVPHDKAGICGYVPYLGADHMLDVMPGAKRITGKVSYNLHNNMRGALVWASIYKSGRDVTDGPLGYTVIHTWPRGTHAKNKSFDYTFGGADGAGYVALALWTGKTGGVKTTAERFVQLEYIQVYTDVVQKTVDEAMLAVANFIGLHVSAATETIGTVLPSMVARPYTDPASAMATFAAQADCLVEWGFHQGEFRARPMQTNPTTIRALPNCYKVDAEDPEIVWNVTQHPENGIARSVRLLYGHNASKSSRWPAGSPAQVVAPADPGWTTGVPFMGTTSPVLMVDFSQRRYTDARAKAIATSLANHLGVALSGGDAQFTGKTIPVYGGGTRPVPYLHGSDWIEAEQGSTGPLYITRAHVVADTGYVDLDVGLSEDLLIEQLQTAGNANTVALHKPYKKRRS